MIITLSMKDSFHKKLKHYADMKGMSVSEYMRYAVIKLWDENKEPKKTEKPRVVKVLPKRGPTKPISDFHDPKSVLCIETNEIYPSVREASRLTGIDYRQISGVCCGRQKTAHGYTWKYISK